ncbi:hypothetical protein ACFE04_012408 [Oxalis oulophora]
MARTTEKPLIGFEMGGTSTDDSRYAGSYEQVLETQIVGAIIQAPQLDTNTVADGNGSKLKFQSGAFRVGPEPVGAHPGPVCYWKGGELAITDANLVLGFVIPDYFPSIFSPKENQPLNIEATIKEFERLDIQCLWHGIGECLLKKLRKPYSAVYNTESILETSHREALLVNHVKQKLQEQGFKNITTDTFLNLRYEGTNTAIMNKNIIICDVRVRGVGVTNILKPQELNPTSCTPKVERHYKVYFENGWHDTPLYKLKNLGYGHVIPEPAIIMNDFSCALFGPDGGLVAYVPHVHVHLGAMSSIIQWELNHWGKDLSEGDVLATNHLSFGGIFQEEVIIKLLTESIHNVPGTRKLQDNLSDLQAQVGANQRGKSFMSIMVWRLFKLICLMFSLSNNRRRGLYNKYVANKVLSHSAGEGIFDFSGTDTEVHGNLNAPEAVTAAAIIYCLRCLVDVDIPLIQGCLAPVKTHIPADATKSVYGILKWYESSKPCEFRRTDESKLFFSDAASQEVFMGFALYFGKKFLFPALGGLLYGYDIGATSCATISIQTSGSLYGASLANEILEYFNFLKIGLVVSKWQKMTLIRFSNMLPEIMLKVRYSGYGPIETKLPLSAGVSWFLTFLVDSVYWILKCHEQPKISLLGLTWVGPSTDVSRYAGSYEQVLETQIVGAIIQAPQLDINKVTAGSGSKLKFQFGAFRVGPESVGAHPGPVCYRKGGEIAIADANLVLGFDDSATDMSVEEIALGFVNVANDTMFRPIRQLTEMKGHETKNHALACFGGAGPQYACAIARSLGMKEVFIHRLCGILSAYGIGFADRSSVGKPGTYTIIMVKRQITVDGSNCNYAAEFEKLYQQEYGFKLQNRNIIIFDVRVHGVGVTNILKPQELNPTSYTPKVERN